MSQRRMDPQVVQDVIERDRGQCINCGSEDRIQIAHIKSRGSRPDLRDEPSNLCCLCYQCHQIRQHSQGVLTSDSLKVLLAKRSGIVYYEEEGRGD